MIAIRKAIEDKIISMFLQGTGGAEKNKTKQIHCLNLIIAFASPLDLSLKWQGKKQNPLLNIGGYPTSATLCTPEPCGLSNTGCPGYT